MHWFYLDLHSARNKHLVWCYPDFFYLTEHEGQSSRRENILLKKWKNGGWGTERQLPSGGFRDSDSWQLQVNGDRHLLSSSPFSSTWKWPNKSMLYSAVSHGRTPTCTGSWSPCWRDQPLTCLTGSSGSCLLLQFQPLNHWESQLVLVQICLISLKTFHISGLINNSVWSLRLPILRRHLQTASWTGKRWELVRETAASPAVLLSYMRTLWLMKFHSTKTIVTDPLWTDLHTRSTSLWIREGAVLRFFWLIHQCALKHSTNIFK